MVAFLPTCLAYFPIGVLCLMTVSWASMAAPKLYLSMFSLFPIRAQDPKLPGLRSTKFWAVSFHLAPVCFIFCAACLPVYVFSLAQSLVRKGHSILVKPKLPLLISFMSVVVSGTSPSPSFSKILYKTSLFCLGAPWPRLLVVGLPGQTCWGCVKSRASDGEALGATFFFFFAALGAAVVFVGGGGRSRSPSSSGPSSARLTAGLAGARSRSSPFSAAASTASRAARSPDESGESAQSVAPSPVGPAAARPDPEPGLSQFVPANARTRTTAKKHKMR
mmetsp:Transcript_7604/g.26146  ORF Transcript_7604/g.26146 Transcript_7604/m.26146 type:complete len:277 (-) Transcript_7604:1857-2687(-)